MFIQTHSISINRCHVGHVKPSSNGRTNLHARMQKELDSGKLPKLSAPKK